MIAAFAAVAALPATRIAAATTGGGRPFSWDRLRAYARGHARQPYVKPAPPVAGLDKVDYDALNAIKYKASATQLRGAAGGGIRFFPTNRIQSDPVEIFIVDGDVARPFRFSPDLFDSPSDSPLRALGTRGGFSGFRAMNAEGESDWMAFAGASYFRTAGILDQYGLSARGLAIDCGGPGTEEFPVFTKFWLGKGADGSLLVDALLESPSAVGAWRFVNRRRPDGIVQEVDVSLTLRADVARLGMAPLTSMFWYDQADRAQATDWRPEIHDSDGLLIANGRGERLLRPLNNPPSVMTNSFADAKPRGFGLLQRDRHFDHYQDDGVFYDKRPSAWVEPRGDWGAGQVMLVEIPTDSETMDNVVAFWVPQAPAKAGRHYEYGYRLSWFAGEPLPAGPARVVDHWRGGGGRPGSAQIKGTTKIVVDFEGDTLKGLTRRSGVMPDLTVARGKIEDSAAYPVVGRDGRFRLMADVTPTTKDPVDIRATLTRDGKQLAEVCVIQLLVGP